MDRRSEPDGRNALHYLCRLPIGDDPEKDERSVRMLLLLLERGMDKNAVHRIRRNHEEGSDYGEIIRCHHAGA